MIKESSFTKEWISKLKVNNKKIDPIICEKMIWALGLLEQLVVNQLDFVFKGGTALILLIDNPQRFSIDIDINTQEQKEKIISILKIICDNKSFIRFEEKARINRGIPKAHFKLFFQSAITNKESHILLDVLFEKELYPEIIQTKISSLWIDTDDNPTFVKTPSIDAILGDKLTVFAPNTTGIAYGCEKSMEMIKQLFDIGRLFDLHNNLEIVAKSFKAIAIQELEYKKSTISLDAVLQDIIDTSLIVSHFPAGKSTDSGKLKELFSGLQSFANYPIGISFRADDAILSAAKAAYLAVKIKNNDFSEIKRFSNKMMIEEFDFSEEFAHLRKLKKRKIEAYYYWLEVFKKEIG